jgi:hypothetical protein
MSIIWKIENLTETLPYNYRMLVNPAKNKFLLQKTSKFRCTNKTNISLRAHRSNRKRLFFASYVEKNSIFGAKNIVE